MDVVKICRYPSNMVCVQDGGMWISLHFICAYGSGRKSLFETQYMSSWWLIARELPDLQANQPAEGKGKKKKEKRASVDETETKEREVIVVDDYNKSQFGDYKLIQSAYKSGRVWTKISSIGLGSDGDEIWVRGRLHTSRVKGKAAFFVLRQGSFSLQGNLFASETIPKDMINFLKK
jgi:lysyl-tRNA synthetase class II